MKTKISAITYNRFSRNVWNCTLHTGTVTETEKSCINDDQNEFTGQFDTVAFLNKFNFICCVSTKVEITLLYLKSTVIYVLLTTERFG